MGIPLVLFRSGNYVEHDELQDYFFQFLINCG